MLVIVDVHSKWIDAVAVFKPTANGTIEAQVFFANFGLPVELVSDNGPQFTAHEFREFCSNNGIKHTLAPPYHLATNGAAVQVVKQAVKKMGTDVSLNVQLTRLLLVYQTTPHATTEMPPDELFLRHRLRTQLTLTKPNCQPTIEQHQQQQQKKHHDSSRAYNKVKKQWCKIKEEKGNGYQAEYVRRALLHT